MIINYPSRGGTHTKTIRNHTRGTIILFGPLPKIVTPIKPLIRSHHLQKHNPFHPPTRGIFLHQSSRPSPTSESENYRPFHAASLPPTHIRIVSTLRFLVPLRVFACTHPSKSSSASSFSRL